MSCVVCKCWNCSDPKCLNEQKCRSEQLESDLKDGEIKRAKRLLEENGFIIRKIPQNK